MPMGAQASVRPKTPPPPPSPPFNAANILILHLLLIFSRPAIAQDHEAQALIKFKASLTNANHPNFATWQPTIPPCAGEKANWASLSCNPDGHVLGLMLENMNLGGVIDVDSLALLKVLRTVSFMGNKFEGSMPDWRKIGALKALYLSNNRFSGQIAVDAFKGMTSLKRVHLANNKFVGPLPTSLQSPKLIELRLENNQFTGTIPKISSENLNILNCSNNQLEGRIPKALANFDPAVFAGNKALCGKPLPNECDPNIYPPDPEEPPSPPASSGPSTPTWVIVLCVAAALILILVVAVLVNRRSRDSQTPQLGRAVPPPLDEEANHVPPAAAPRSQPAAEGGGGKGPSKKSEQQQPGKLTFVREERQKFDLQDLMRASAEVLGSGNFGASYKAVLVDREALVVKRFKQMNHIAREDFHEHMRRLGRLKHHNLLPLVAYLYRKEEKLLVFDFVHNGSLATHLHGKHSATLNWGTRLKIIKGVGKGLLYLQNEVPTLIVSHGHLKSSNVLLDKDFNPLLMDYALAPVVNSNQLHNVLLAYKSPEYANLGRVSKKTDVWCLGTLILETLTGRYLAQGSSADLCAWVNGIAAEEYANVFDKEMQVGKDSRGQMEKMLQIGVGCCQEDPEKRWDLEEAVRQIEQIQIDDNDQLLLSIAN